LIIFYRFLQILCLKKIETMKRAMTQKPPVIILKKFIINRCVFYDYYIIDGFNACDMMKG
jgi:hypothetical protein